MLSTRWCFPYIRQECFLPWGNQVLNTWRARNPKWNEWNLSFSIESLRTCDIGINVFWEMVKKAMKSNGIILILPLVNTNVLIKRIQANFPCFLLLWWIYSWYKGTHLDWLSYMHAKKLAHTNKYTSQHEGMRLHQMDGTILMEIYLSSLKTRKSNAIEK